MVHLEEFKDFTHNQKLVESFAAEIEAESAEILEGFEEIDIDDLEEGAIHESLEVLESFEDIESYEDSIFEEIDEFESLVESYELIEEEEVNEGIATAVGNAIKKAGSSIGGAVKKAGSAAGGAVKTVAKRSGELLAAAKKKGKEMFDAVKLKIQSMYKSAKESFAKKPKTPENKGKFRTLMTSIRTKAAEMWTKVKAAVTNLMNRVTGKSKQIATAPKQLN
jgi:hypothetical protein